MSFTIKPTRAYPQHSISEIIIQKLNLLLAVDFRFIYEILVMAMMTGCIFQIIDSLMEFIGVGLTWCDCINFTV